MYFFGDLARGMCYRLDLGLKSFAGKVIPAANLLPERRTGPFRFTFTTGFDYVSYDTACSKKKSHSAYNIMLNEA